MTNALSPPSRTHPAADDLAWLRALAHRVARPEDDPEDLLHETWMCSATATTTPIERRPWLAGILRNRRRMHARQDQRRLARERAVTAVPLAERPLPDAVVHTKAVAQAIRSAMAELSSADRELLEQRFWADLSPTDIAKKLGVSPSTLRTRLQRALARVRSEVQRRIGGEPQDWCIALAASGRESVPLTTGATAGTLAKISATVVGLVLSVGVGRLACTESPNEQLPPVDPSAPWPKERSAKASSELVHGPKRPEEAGHAEGGRSEARWQALRAGIRQARTRRFDAADSAPSLPTVAGPIDPSLGGGADQAQLADLLEPVMEGMQEGTTACGSDLNPGRAARPLDLTVNLIGEPGIGAIVESVEVDGPISGELAECLEAAAHTLEFPDPRASLLQTLKITVDVDRKSISVGWPMNPENASEMFTRFPELGELPAEAFAEMFEDNPKVEGEFRRAVAADPTLLDRVPALAAALSQTRRGTSE